MWTTRIVPKFPLVIGSPIGQAGERARKPLLPLVSRVLARSIFLAHSPVSVYQATWEEVSSYAQPISNMAERILLVDKILKTLCCVFLAVSHISSSFSWCKDSCLKPRKCFTLSRTHAICPLISTQIRQ